MRRMNQWCTAVLIAASVSGVSAQSQTSAPPVRREILWPANAAAQWQNVRSLLSRMADKMPAEHYAFRPTPDMRTFAANVAHIASGNLNTCANLLGKTHPLMGRPLETMLTQKTELVDALEAGAKLCDEYLAQLTSAAQLTDRFYEISADRNGVRNEIKAAHGVLLSSLLSHSNEMYGYMAVYLRLKGIVPPSSERATAAPSAPAAAPAAADTISKAIEAAGGAVTLSGIRSVALEVMGHQWALEQSERPEGPWLSTYVQRSELRDLAGDRRLVSTQRRDWNFPTWSPASTTVVAGGISGRRSGDRWFGGAPTDVRDWEQSRALGPERLLVTARDAADLRSLPDEVHQDVVQRVVAFSHGGQAYRLFLNAWTHLPTMLELVRDDAMWGDVTERRWFSFWTMHAGGLMYPRQTSIEWNGRPYADWTVHDVKVNPAVDGTQFAIPEEAAKGYAATATRPAGMNALTLDESRVVAVNDWITQLGGGFNVEVIRQPDGLVIFEATTTSAYSAAVLALVERRFPGVPIKAVVTTSDAWPHLSGIREYVAREIPVYALDLNVPILSRMIAAPRSITPDALARTPRTPKLTAVSARTTIGTGDTRIELLPVRGETGERMMVAWLPGAKLLYSSDLIQRGRTPGSFFMPMMLAEVAAVAEREQLGVIDRVFGMHLPPTPWTQVTEAIAAARK